VHTWGHIRCSAIHSKTEQLCHSRLRHSTLQHTCFCRHAATPTAYTLATHLQHVACTGRLRHLPQHLPVHRLYGALPAGRKVTQHRGRLGRTKACAAAAHSKTPAAQDRARQHIAWAASFNKDTLVALMLLQGNWHLVATTRHLPSPPCHSTQTPTRSQTHAALQHTDTHPPPHNIRPPADRRTHSPGIGCPSGTALRFCTCSAFLTNSSRPAK
jgi:hypothetical protein